jgi:hypothetical protein
MTNVFSMKPVNGWMKVAVIGYTVCHNSFPVRALKRAEVRAPASTALRRGKPERGVHAASPFDSS